MRLIWIVLLGTLRAFSCASGVLELNENFPQIRKEGGFWLVQFYAPWCGHCKKLEPVWGEVADALSTTNILVGRVDCSRYASIAGEFEVLGYPTIKFISPNSAVTFQGNRKTDEILNFAFKMSSPPVQQITDSESMQKLRDLDKLFFLYIGSQEGPLWKCFHNIALKLQPHGYFYAANKEIGRNFTNITHIPVILVHKEKSDYFYVDNGIEDMQELNSSLYQWVNEERFPVFLRVTRNNINQLLQISKYLALVVVEEHRKKRVIPAHMLEFKDMVESLVKAKREKYRKQFQFGWTSSPDIAFSVAMDIISLPTILVFNSTNYYHLMPKGELFRSDPEVIDIFLERVSNQSVPAYGGNNFLIRMYRTVFDARLALTEMWFGNRLVTAVLIGLPIVLITFIFYSLCCADMFDLDDDDDEEFHHKKD